MTEMTEKEKEDLASDIHERGLEMKEHILEIAGNIKLNSSLRHNMVITLISMLICEAGAVLYPIFGEIEVEGMLKHIDQCIEDMVNHNRQEADGEIPEEDRQKISEALKKAAENFANGTATGRTIKLNVK